MRIVDIISGLQKDIASRRHMFSKADDGKKPAWAQYNHETDGMEKALKFIIRKKINEKEARQLQPSPL